MDQKKIERINALSRKARTEGLTPEEEQERAALRREYADAVLGNLRGHLDKVYIAHPDGRVHKLKKKEE